MDGRPTPVLDARAMRALDRFTIDSGTPGLELMERAGRAVTGHIATNIVTADGGRVLVLAGRGSNGGDGLVIARLLVEHGWQVDVALVAGEPAANSDAATNLGRWRDLDQGPALNLDAATRALATEEPGYVLVVDTIFGTGLDRELDGEMSELVGVLNSARSRSGLAVLAVDLPSGLSADSGQRLGAAVTADNTITIGAGKPGLFLGAGIEAAGRVTVADIGLAGPADAGLDVLGEVLDERGCRRFLSPRGRGAHKGSQGHLLIIGGSAGKTGAAKLAARAALRSGAGLVSLAVPSSVAAAVDSEFTEAMTIAVADREGQLDRGAMAGLAELERFDAIVAGPGLGTGPGAAELVEALVSTVEAPLLLDADALNVVAAGIGTAGLARARAGRPLTLTPHPGEMARLLGTDSATVQNDRLAACRKVLADGSPTVVLKGAATIVASVEQLAFNSSGNPGMATAGMGDVLAGTIGALAAAGSEPFEAAALGVYLHGTAADILAGGLGGPGFLAGEVADTLPRALAALMRGPSAPEL